MLPKVLSIAGFDPISGAGITADVKTAEAFRCYGLAAISSIVIQDSKRVKEASAVQPDILKKQIDLLFHDAEIQSAKTGILHSAENVKAVAKALAAHKVKQVVVDPIISASSGYRFLDEEAINALKKELLPIAKIVTPNTHEASILSGMKVMDLESMKKAAKEIHAFGVKHVVLKGGHLDERAMDLLYDGKRFHLFDSVKIKGDDFHGLGCAFSMAIACCLAQGEEVHTAVNTAKKFISRLLSRPIKIGKGKSVLDHMNR
jgi:hydroxymethylpyrimidine/phosphomethylpyrimidine kinase